MEIARKHIYKVSMIDGSKPYIRLSGMWLQRLGFEVGTRFTVSYDVERGAIVLAPVPENSSNLASTAESNPNA